MAVVILRLKLALLRGTVRQARTQGIVGLVFALVVSLGVGMALALSLAALRLATPETAAEVVLAAFALMLFVWMLGPVITAASDGTLPPERLAPFPISAPQLMAGLLLAAAAGFGGLCTALALGGGAVGLAPAGPLALVAVLAMVAQFATCVVFGRLLAAAISSAARRRRGRDIALLFGPVLGLAVNIGLQAMLRSTFDPADPRRADLTAWRAIRPFLSALPSGPPALAAGMARQGRALPAFGWLGVSAAVLAAGLALWHRALQRSLTSEGGSGPARGRPPRSLFPAFARWLPRTRVGAIAARELRLTWRDPRQRAALFGSVFAPVLLVFSLRTMEAVTPSVVLLGIAPALFLAIGSANLWGYDGRAAWTDAAAPGDRRGDVVGKLAARAVVSFGMTALAIGGLSLRVGSASRVADATALGIGAFGLASGVAVVLAVRYPYPMPESTTNVFSSGTSGQGFGQASIALGLLFVSALVVVPVGALLVRLEPLVPRLAVGAAFAVGGLLVLRAGVRSSAAYLEDHTPEVLERLIPERA